MSEPQVQDEAPTVEASEEHFETLWTEWQEVLAQSADAAAGEALEWEDEMASMLEEQRALEAREAWVSGPRDILTLLGLSRLRRAHSPVLGWLLDPWSPHPYGFHLFAALMKHCGVELDVKAAPPSRLRVVWDAKTAGAYVDVAAAAPGLALLITLDVDGVAVQGSGVLDAMYKAFRHEEGAHFLVITRDATVAHEAYHRMTWVELIEVLKSLDGAVTPSCVMLSAYLETLEVMFGPP